MSGTVLSTEDSAGHKTDKNLCPVVWETDNNQDKKYVGGRY